MSAVTSSRDLAARQAVRASATVAIGGNAHRLRYGRVVRCGDRSGSSKPEPPVGGTRSG